jgi:hypothetical protein
VLGIALLLLLPVLLFAAALAIFSGEAVEVRTDLQKCADAAALAGVQVFVDDRMLLRRRSAMLELIEKARAEAGAYALANPVLGRPLRLLPNPTNDPAGDVVFATLERPRAKRLLVADLVDPHNELLHEINTVRVQACSTADHGQAARLNRGQLLSPQPTDAVGVATATLDRDVIGFRPKVRHLLPLAPLAVRSDPAGVRKDSWEYQVERKGGTDQWRFDHRRQVFVRGADGLFEMTVKLKLQNQSSGQQSPTGTQGSAGGRQGQGSGGGGQAGPGGAGSSGHWRGNACLLQLGAQDLAALAHQLVVGVSRDDLRLFGGELVLGPNNRLVVPGTPHGPAAGSSDLRALRQALQQLQAHGTPRIWPLCSAIDGSVHMPVLSGFVAARVAHVSDAQDADSLTFVLQPCVIARPDAVTDAARRRAGGISIVNRYICKVRLVE